LIWPKIYVDIAWSLTYS